MTKLVIGLLAAGALGVTGAAVQVLDSEDSADLGVVTHLVDGDTFDARIDGEVQRIRMLNIDTPETKDPDAGIECLGPEAADYLAELIPVGTSIRLAYDVERTDRYGRTLAGVFVDDDSFVNAEMARAGLAAPVVFGQNDRFYPEVLAAGEQAADAARGLFSEAAECTLPGRVARLSETVTQAPTAGAQPPDASAAQLDAAVEVAEAALAATDRVLDEFGGQGRGSAWAVLAEAERERLVERARDLRSEAEEKAHDLRDAARAAREREQAQAQARAEAAARAEATARAEARRQAEAAEREAAEREAAEREAAEREVTQRRYVPPAPDPAPKPSREVSSDPGPSSANPYPGYTGPRCYEPGGKVWHPC